MVEQVRISNRADTESYLSSLGIPFKTETHKEIFTVKEGLEILQDVQGEFIKNLFLKDKKGKFYLLSALHSTEFNFKQLQKMLPGTGGSIRQAPEDTLPELLGVARGAVTPLALVNDPQQKVTFLMDKNMTAVSKVLVHPMENTSTTEILVSDLMKVMEHIARPIKVLDFTPPKEEVKVEEKKETKLSISVSKETNFSAWYSEVITKGQMIEYYDISGCYIIRPWAFEIWEYVQQKLDRDFKSIGVKNAYFPIFVSERALKTEESHIEGFAPEVAWVTKSGDTELKEHIAVRPTSETIMYPAYAKWIRSHRDLPLKLNQWCNVVRWEFKHPTPFLRTREFLWQEGHTAHKTYDEAVSEVFTILDFYANAYEELLAVPMIKGKKSETEKFAGGEMTTTIETIIPSNGRGIQAATSHCLGQNFSKMFEIFYEDESGHRQLVWQNSWGFTTRSIGVMVMIHGDDKGLVLPPRVAPIQVIIIPILDKTATAEILSKAEEMSRELESMGIRCKLDDRTNVTAGWKYNHWELMGVPLRMEIGPIDIKERTVRIVKRYNREKANLSWDNIGSLPGILEEIQSSMLEGARNVLQSKTKTASNWNEFLELLNGKNIVLTPWCQDVNCEKDVKERSGEESKEIEGAELTGAAKTLCMPLEQEPIKDGEGCFCCGKPATARVLWGRSY